MNLQRLAKEVQIHTGGACHLDAPMAIAALDNLICPAEVDIGSDMQAMILSVPQGGDKILKYPLMFTISEVLLVNKIDYRTARISTSSSCKTGAGFGLSCSWLLEKSSAKNVNSR